MMRCGSSMACWTPSRNHAEPRAADTPPRAYNRHLLMSNEAEQTAQRQAKLDALSAMGVRPYPTQFDRTGDGGGRSRRAWTRRRVRRWRPNTSTRAWPAACWACGAFGKANFLVLSDGIAKLQVYVRADSVPELDFRIFKHLDLGDHIGVEGRLFRTKTNELTIWASRVHFLAKCLLPLPEKCHGLTDVETRYRQRYLDLIVNPDSRRVFETRGAGGGGDPRASSTGAGFLEVETPMMQPIAGGALARPFITHHNALDMRPLPAHRARALPQAPHGRRPRARLRDQPELPERRHLHAAQSRVHDARVLRGLRGLPAPDAVDRGDAHARSRKEVLGGSLTSPFGEHVDFLRRAVSPAVVAGTPPPRRPPNGWDAR